MAANHPTHHAQMAEVVEPAFAAVALACGIHQGEIARAAMAITAAGAGFGIALFNRARHIFSKANAHKTAGGDGVAVFNQHGRFAQGNHFAIVGLVRCGGDGMGGLGHFSLSPWQWRDKQLNKPLQPM